LLLLYQLARVKEVGKRMPEEEIAKRLEVSTRKIEAVFRAIQDPIALQAPVGDEGFNNREIHQ
jgi:DNA-directed RNA polymerase sigma subunit (sigma70/sigma32)